jgi:hypothetical protein
MMNTFLVEEKMPLVHEYSSIGDAIYHETFVAHYRNNAPAIDYRMREEIFNVTYKTIRDVAVNVIENALISQMAQFEGK